MTQCVYVSVSISLSLCVSLHVSSVCISVCLCLFVCVLVYFLVCVFVCSRLVRLPGRRASSTRLTLLVGGAQGVWSLNDPKGDMGTGLEGHMRNHRNGVLRWFGVAGHTCMSRLLRGDSGELGLEPRDPHNTACCLPEL